MNKQIQVLYTIFELELAPPFELLDKYHDLRTITVRNKYLTDVGSYNKLNNRFSTFVSIDRLILNRIRQTFNVDRLSNEDVYYIAKHLCNWMRGKISEEVNEVVIRNDDTHMNVEFET